MGGVRLTILLLVVVVVVVVVEGSSDISFNNMIDDEDYQEVEEKEGKNPACIENQKSKTYIRAFKF